MKIEIKPVFRVILNIPRDVSFCNLCELIIANRGCLARQAPVITADSLRYELIVDFDDPADRREFTTKMWETMLKQPGPRNLEISFEAQVFVPTSCRV